MIIGQIVGVLGAAFKKNVLEYIRYPVNMVFSFIMPVVWVLPYYFLMRSFAPDGSSVGLASWVGSSDFLSYFMIGLLVSQVIMTIFWNIGFSMKRLMDIGLLETLWTCPMPKILYVLGESLFSLVRLVYEILLLYVIFRFVFGMTVPSDILRYAVYFIPFVFLMYGFGIGFAALVLRAKEAGMMVDTLSFLAMGLTGTQNPPQVFPRLLLILSLAIPITYFIDIIRVKSMGITPLANLGTETAILFASAVLVPILGIMFFKRTDVVIRKKGNLHVH